MLIHIYMICIYSIWHMYVILFVWDILETVGVWGMEREGWLGRGVLVMGGHASAGWREVLGAVCQQAIVVVSGWNTGLRQAESVRCGSICVRREPMYYSWWKITQTLLTSAIQSQHTSSCRGVGGVWRWLGAYNIPLWDQSAFIFMSSNRSEWPQSVILSEGPQSARHIQVYTNTGSHGLPFTLLTGWFMQ